MSMRMINDDSGDIKNNSYDHYISHQDIHNGNSCIFLLRSM